MRSRKIDQNLVFLRKSINDYTDNDHNNKIIQDRLWNEISLEMGTSGKLIKI
jgi:hypothetical protein